MSVNDWRSLEWKSPLRAWIIPQLTNKPVISPFYGKKTQGYLYTSSHSSHKTYPKAFSYGNFISPSFLNGDCVYSLCIHVHLFRVNTLLMNISSWCIFQLEHLLAVFPLWAPQLLPWSHGRDTWPKWNCIKAQWECILSQWASTGGLRALTPGQRHCRWATKTYVENIHLADRERGSSCQELHKEEALHSSVL